MEPFVLDWSVSLFIPVRSQTINCPKVFQKVLLATLLSVIFSVSVVAVIGVSEKGYVSLELSVETAGGTLFDSHRALGR